MPGRQLITAFLLETACLAGRFLLTETTSMAFIEVRNLFKCFKKVVAVNHIDLEVNEGEMLTLLGPSGCGKTTTLRCIAGLEKPEEGDIVIDGKPMLSEGFVEPSKRGIGMVFQNYAVWPHMKVYKNIVYGLKIQKIPKQSIKERAQQVLDLVGLDGLEERYPGQLSGGQQPGCQTQRRIEI
jgi:ABC-type Fe3+/spermidine/putrescine transport system ATPase subunit